MFSAALRQCPVYSFSRASYLSSSPPRHECSKKSDKPSGQFLDLIVMSHWVGEVWIRIWDIFVVLPHYLSYGESRLFVLWCVGGRCSMAGSDEDHDRSRRPDAEDQGLSGISRVFSGRTIEMSGDTVCGLHHTWGDEGHMFLGWASKPMWVVC
jgi:hypothetical protein